MFSPLHRHVQHIESSGSDSVPSRASSSHSANIDSSSNPGPGISFSGGGYGLPFGDTPASASPNPSTRLIGLLPIMPYKFTPPSSSIGSLDGHLGAPDTVGVGTGRIFRRGSRAAGPKRRAHWWRGRRKPPTRFCGGRSFFTRQADVVSGLTLPVQGSGLRRLRKEAF